MKFSNHLNIKEIAKSNARIEIIAIVFIPFISFYFFNIFYLFILFFNTALMKALYIGDGKLGLLLNSGWNWVPTIQ